MITKKYWNAMCQCTRNQIVNAMFADRCEAERTELAKPICHRLTGEQRLILDSVLEKENEFIVKVLIDKNCKCSEKVEIEETDMPCNNVNCEQ